jgi:hypothetical protein
MVDSLVFSTSPVSLSFGSLAERQNYYDDENMDK